MSTSADCDSAAVATKRSTRHRHTSNRCTAAPLPPATTAPTPGVLHEIYYDDHQSYLGFVDDNAASEYSEESMSMPDHDDSDFEERLNMHVREKSAYLAISASPLVMVDAAAGAPVAVPPFRRERRNNPYDLRVLPDWAYRFIVPPPIYPIVDQPMTEVANADAGEALMSEEELAAMQLAMQQQQEAFLAANGYLPSTGVDGEEDYLPSAVPQPAGAPTRGPVAFLGSNRAPRTAAPPAGSAAAAAASSGVMCCYWKQGHCSMGASCWYRHEGSADTPCHYGASCRKGHRHLVRSNPAAPPVPKNQPQEQQVAAQSQSMLEVQQAMTPQAQAIAAAAAAATAAGAIPRRYVHEAKPPRPSAPLLDSDLPCPHCGECGTVRTQDFPLYEGNRVRQATRGHCGSCRRTFMVAA